jgi:hypothetical protein
VREALEELAAAERLATLPQDVAHVRQTRARLLQNWGFAWESLFELDRVLAIAPEWRDVVDHRVTHLESMGLPPAFGSSTP